MTFDVPAQVIDSRTMAPLRAIFEAMGATVTWDNVTQTAMGVRGIRSSFCRSIPYPDDQRVVCAAGRPGADRSGRTLAPLRFVGEAFGGNRHMGQRDGKRVDHDKRLCGRAGRDR
jgi:N-acetylmuramoyl-L-alanine amidase